MRYDEEKNEIRAGLERLAEAWNQGDATAYADEFTADADYITFFGQRFRGRKAIEESHRYLFEGPLKGSRMDDAGETNIKMLSPDVAVVISTGGVEVDVGAGVPPERESIVSFTAVRDGEHWKFASFHNTRRSPRPDAA
ncbi:SgcJ/EcaC family oxidoreductase [Haloglycomyces albus]|uniref:SgcJ/EcaC family oxidoreductase n=1 Tax=Haloglycomyces albus TaxID=526067 RepID=UPI00046D5273|nr:SgcJ/EcaC family oxidoreductase [Haloglycomyces albus]